MNMRHILTGSAALAIGALALSGCSGDSGGGDSGGDVSLSVWQNSTTGDGVAYWEDAAAAFEEANPGVTVEIQSIQNEDMDGKLQTALNSGDAPDVFMARGGGKLADVVKAGQVMDLTDKISSDAASAMSSSLSAFTYDGKLYGMPLSVLPEGLFYSQDLFDQAGVSGTPGTIDELIAVNDELKSAGIDPIAVGAKDAWPAAHWYYNFALRECSQDVMNEAADSRSFDDECWLRAGEDLQDFADTEPFNQGYLTTAAQQGAGSSAGLLANQQAAMELMGAWEPGVVASLTPDEQPLADLSWFAFPEISGGDGTPGAMMGGADGYSCYVDAPAECVNFLNFLASKEQQEAYADAFQTLPSSQEAQSVVTDPALVSVLEAYNDAPYVVLWLDTLYGQNVGNALNVAVVDMLAGSGTPESIVSAVNDAALRG
ncbi:ABC-type glycerol-3-phosphate transport system substrate-binding protein [Microbacterium halimionae]|uniref:ABC-type glycerol-3-phosphate transport system substrate-binding protein n=1 Tax=Microbacterium halimionae TaxID=1526413 RepID=A0A7W3PMT8_9MICO|nr:extracellular solute-binding protein [Microbacterium halimionae]MBA8817274.1 ABC-type glycerol-3-phosphate transport system substrate-binding protein [Microbacterium halimionae]NII94724.1 ABC-type glycerol-3-phosphate transport system substrate-binding protein [Microbacterium halimionae]